MSKRRITQVFPFLLPIRKWQRKKLFYLKMRFDRKKYAKKKADSMLPNTVFQTSSLMINENSGFDLQYQFNKVHNLKLAAKTINGLLLEPGNTFSFWQLVRWADRHEKYKDGLNLVDGKIIGSYGGGICQLSGMLYWMFLHTPLTIVERHGHRVEAIPPAGEDLRADDPPGEIYSRENATSCRVDLQKNVPNCGIDPSRPVPPCAADSLQSVLPAGVDATVNEGWLDLKVYNGTENTYQIKLDFDERSMYGSILAQSPASTEYTIFNPFVSYFRQGGRVFQKSIVCRAEKDRLTGVQTIRKLYENQCEIGYELPKGTFVNEEREDHKRESI